MRFIKTTAIPLLLLLLVGAACRRSDPSLVQGPEARPQPAQLLLELNDERRFMSVDQVADQIIKKLPELLLVDVRSDAEFKAYSLPGAVHIPLDKLLEPANQQRLDCGKYSIVFYSNGQTSAEKAWFITRQRGCRDVYVMQGGLNEWTVAFLQPQEPAQTAPQEVWDQYQFRIAARQYFAGASKALAPEPFQAPAAAPEAAAGQTRKNIEVKPKAAKPAAKDEEEGC